ncbi:hypothetical protein JCM1393_26980 [Clostridium carnis]
MNNNLKDINKNIDIMSYDAKDKNILSTFYGKMLTSDITLIIYNSYEEANNIETILKYDKYINIKNNLIFDNLIMDEDISSIISKINLLNRDLIKKKELLYKIFNIFFNKNDNGKSLLDMYKCTNKIINNSDIRYRYYYIYKENLDLNKYSYSYLKNITEEILNDNILLKYIKFRRFSNNKVFDRFINNIKSDIVDNTYKKISKLLNNPISFELPLYSSKYKKDFIETFLIKNNIDNESLKTLSEVVNIKYNGDLLTRKPKKKLWNPLNWNKNRENKKIEEKNLLLYKHYEDEILFEYKENLEYLSIYIKAFDFLKEVVNDKEYKIFIR